jgi:polysaccharide export outer membrane protein
MRRILMILLVVTLAIACVPTKKLTYLQESKSAVEDTNSIYPLARTDYQLQTNDIISINVRSFDEKTSMLFNLQSTGNGNAGGAAGMGDMLFYLQGYPVDADGNIEMPIMGQVNVIGKTIEEIQLIVEEKLNAYFVEDAVFVTVRLAGIRYSVVGEVRSPGRYVIFANQVNIFEALSQCGDITMVGNRTKVMIVRQTPTGTKTFYVDLTEADALSNPLYFVQPNDIINVQPLRQKSWGTGTTGIQTFSTVLSVVASSIALFVAFNNF